MDAMKDAIINLLKSRYIPAFLLFIIMLTIYPLSTYCFIIVKTIQMEGNYKMGYPSYQQCNYSPIFDDDEMGIKIGFINRKTQIEFSKDDQWLLFGAYQVGKKIIAEFGREIDPNILVLVTHKETRAIYSGRIIKDDLPEKPVINGGESNLISLKSYFNIDIKKQCRISEQPGKYWVVVLLGTLSSPVLEFEVK
ncbi:MAG: hypothetical protein DRH26_06390 [Deltaproteobacteria bacterium]|nr:MAG: hypothetical protein DRH26_06390 [Deltaproteobacteria bacterium]